ncbi:major capsid protein [Salmonella enterica]|nr:major capsid protein [Salmonella enterica]EBS0795541.1 major capsid protein [Salmonella enterica subsp. enterica serovar Overschie]ECB6428418.1 major capsid protein [Salmonella enterica subsp. enterica serovar Adelaide]ECD6162065.1 major capsid protein [Salmonella enterica subsp. enterica]ECU7994681.1 major capsid protein [Salmonella enterica subsp. enterica serovar Toucra]EID1775590.1 major capsid protein [Salmonella enterica subsp. enterica serovar Cotham]
MTAQVSTLNLPNLLQVIGRKDVKEFNFSPLFTSLFFPDVVTFSTRDIALDTLDIENVVMSAFCSPMVGSRVQRDKGYETATFTPGYLKPKNEIDPSKTIIRLPGEDPAALNNPSYRRCRLIHDALRRQAKSIKARVEWLAVNAITTGKNTIEGEGIERYELDWKLPAANIITQVSGKKWSEQDRNNFDPTPDIELYSEVAEGPINVIVMGGKVWRLLRSFKIFRELFDNRRGSNSRAELATKDLGEAVSFKGWLGDVALIVYTGKYTDDEGVQHYFLDQDCMVLGNTENQGLVAYGAIMDQDAVRADQVNMQYYPKNWVQPGDPAIEYVQTHSAPQPVPVNIGKFVTVHVS